MIISPPPFSIFNETLADSSMIISLMIDVTLSLVLLSFYSENNLQTTNGQSLVGWLCIPSRSA